MLYKKNINKITKIFNASIEEVVVFFLLWRFEIQNEENNSKRDIICFRELAAVMQQD